MTRVSLAIATLVLAAASACGGGSGGSESPLEAYFGRLEELDKEFGGRLADLSADLEDDLTSAQTTEEAIETSHDGIEAFAGVVDGFAASLKELAVPAEAAEANQQAIDAGVIVSNELGIIADHLETVTSAEEAASVTSAAFTSEGFDRFGDACRALQAVADGHGIDVDLDCGG